MIALVAALLLAGEPAPGLGDAVQSLHAGRLEHARLIRADPGVEEQVSHQPLHQTTQNLPEGGLSSE
jgi:hypothetical protein